jgi:O-antigen ligase
LFFIIVGFVVSLKHCKRLMYVLVGADVLLLVDCVVTSRASYGRLDIPGSIFFSNANDLSLQLGLAITHFFYMLIQPRLWQKILGAAGISMALVYDLQTGSRGGTLALLAMTVVIFVVGKHRLLLAAVVLAAGLAAVVTVPSAAFHRISLLTEEQGDLDQSDLSAAGSRIQRLQVLGQSLTLTITHPLFGVGPGQFAVAVAGEDAKEGTRAPWLGTHNSYTEMSSESGIPAAIFFVSIVMVCLISNLRMYQRSKRHPRLQDVNSLAFSLLCGSVLFAVAIFFYHIAYSTYLPMLAGMTAALRLTTDGSLWGRA